MILTVTLNPAMDRVIIIDELKLGSLNRVKEVHDLAGGKGINVAEVLTKLEEESIALGIVGGNNGSLINSILEKNRVRADFIWSEHNTRQNLKIKEKNKNRETEINENGQIDPEDLESFKNNLKKYLKKNKVLILSGSLPDGADENTYAELIKIANDNNSKVIFDSSGRPLAAGIKEKPYLIKPNLEELKNLTGSEIENNIDLLEASKYILNKGIKIIMVSLGSNGSYIASEEEAYRFYTPAVKVEQTTIGAGDTMVAGLAKKIREEVSLKDMGIYSSALATTFVEKGKISEISEKNIEDTISKIKVEKLK
ncbi:MULTISPECIES: 1-phosphofructokinase family hexose kinase [unclassified Halanaerobium]|uniref:1-phosphofructokinase family hexose kinase n=1 Tax=unclassified Halanaerobium TaxID=2641197 RepID=UPI000DF40944|nr:MULTISPECIES: 1-phosphofructokinase family hexose kinase [unclassified Halanaerobium]RCW41684.1 fructose-1-phosphate kinase [Halanaerobium sp. MA284_MarDTE_T2]RCW78384.1 fructose-1-phosphate kinase [Halanaerobium sp. DL-01]